jgi:hypothetical protein
VESRIAVVVGEVEAAHGGVVGMVVKSWGVWCRYGLECLGCYDVAILPGLSRRSAAR